MPYSSAYDFGVFVERQFAGLAHRNETGADRVRERRAKNVTARFDSDDVVDARHP